MKLNSNVNAILNDIMASDCTAVLLFAGSEYNRTDFVTELGNRYFKRYWFNAAIDDAYQLCITLADRVLVDFPEERLRLRQLLFCQSRYNGPKTVIKAVLEYIASIKRDVLFVFENMDVLPEDFDYTYFLYMINHAPENLKIVISASRFLPIDLYRFEPRYPMLIGEEALLKCEDSYTFEEYLSDLTDEQIATLCYFADCNILSAVAIRESFPDGEALLRYLGRKGVYVSSREIDNDDVIYQLSSSFTYYLKEIRADYEDLIASFAQTDIVDLMLNSQLIKTDAFEYLLVSLQLNRYENAEEALGIILRDGKQLTKLPNFLLSHVELSGRVYPAEYKKLQLFSIALDIYQNRNATSALQRSKELREYFYSNKDYLDYFILVAAECICLEREGRNAEIMERLKEADEFVKVDESYKYYGFVIRMILPECVRFGEWKTATIEEFLEQESIKNSFWYLKALEDLEFLYYTLGNYRKALFTAGRIKAIIPTYVIPPRLIAMGYFDNSDINKTENQVEEALKFAVANDLQEDIHMLYSAKALVCAYRGQMAKSVEYGYKSLVNVGKEDSYEKYFTIMCKVWAHAKAGEHKYAHALATVYLGYVRAKAPQYTQFMAAALAYVLYKMGDIESSYSLSREAIEVGENRSIAWMMCMGLATDYLLSKGDTREIDVLINKIIKVASSHGMLMLMVDYAHDVYAPLLEYAKENAIEPKTIEMVMSLVRAKDGDKEVAANVKLSMFGDVSITVEGKEIQWKTRKSKDLFLHYILAGEVGIDRNVIIDFLWKDYLYESAINNLKTTNNIIRKTLDAYGVKYKLNYINSRYAISLENLDNDYTRYKKLVDNYVKETDLMRKVDVMNGILKIYKADFASDINYSDFEHERTSVKQELIIMMMKLIRQLAKAGEYVESKHFLNALTLIDGDNDYSHMIAELDRFINITK
ncbi:MAG: hypothetical protein J6R35_03060 [Clostridia bacterium]|nr:hypothetical protein [Clostridia bacterium]